MCYIWFICTHYKSVTFLVFHCSSFGFLELLNCLPCSIVGSGFYCGSRSFLYVLLLCCQRFSYICHVLLRLDISAVELVSAVKGKSHKMVDSCSLSRKSYLFWRALSYRIFIHIFFRAVIRKGLCWKNDLLVLCLSRMCWCSFYFFKIQYLSNWVLDHLPWLTIFTDKPC